MAHLVRSLALDPKKPLLLTFDAFGTLYKPRAAIGTIYADCARKYGLTGFTDVEIGDRLKHAFKRQRTIAPNYGAGTLASSPYGWWRQIACLTFAELETDITMVDTIFDDLWKQFGSSQAYRLQPNALDICDTLRRLRGNSFNWRGPPSFTVGVLSNSDPRVSEILSSFGIQVRHGNSNKGIKSHFDCASSTIGSEGEIGSDIGYDFDFVITSYEVGFEKPAQEFFEVARQRALPFEEDDTDNRANLQCLHVGDDVLEDYDGAYHAGWKAILVGSERDQDTEAGLTSVAGLEDVKKLLQQLYQRPEHASED